MENSLRVAYPNLRSLVQFSDALDIGEPCRFLEVFMKARSELYPLGHELYDSDEYLEKVQYEYLLVRVLHELNVRKEKKRIASFLSNTYEGEKDWAFVTVGFNDSIVTDVNETGVFNAVVAKVIGTAGFMDVKFVCEKHRVNGIHRHIHFLIKTDLKKSKIIQYVHQKTKAYTYGSQCVDVKTWKDARLEVYENYISGNKKEEKMSYVEKDKEWRRACGIREM